MRVLVVDDQDIVRRGITRLLNLEEAVEVVGEARDGAEALRQVARSSPDVALVDARMPRMDGVELVGRLAEEHPRVAAVILTTFDDDEYVFGGLRAGAKGYLLKDAPLEELVLAIRRAGRGETFLGGPIASRVIAELGRVPEQPKGPNPEEATTPGGDAGLSGREIEVLRLVGEGATNAEIARALHIGEGTARNHVSHILRKLGLRDRTRAALYAVENGYAERGRARRP